MSLPERYYSPINPQAQKWLQIYTIISAKIKCPLSDLGSSKKLESRQWCLLSFVGTLFVGKTKGVQRTLIPSFAYLALGSRVISLLHEIKKPQDET